jgi:hypothetical protein
VADVDVDCLSASLRAPIEVFRNPDLRRLESRSAQLTETLIDGHLDGNGAAARASRDGG